jgi:hypothetical protein
LANFFGQVTMREAAMPGMPSNHLGTASAGEEMTCHSRGMPAPVRLLSASEQRPFRINRTQSIAYISSEAIELSIKVSKVTDHRSPLHQNVKNFRLNGPQSNGQLASKAP